VALVEALTGFLIKFAPLAHRVSILEEVEYVGSAAALAQVWAVVRDMLELVTVADVAAADFRRTCSPCCGTRTCPRHVS
jgi:hypothetical protein